MNDLRIPNARAFISYSHLDRVIGAQVKGVLEGVGIDTFLAHDDIEVSEQWRNRILQEMDLCHIFVPLFSKNFLSSNWAPQEAGYIVSRQEVAIAPLSIDGTIPTGFLAYLQGRRIPADGVTQELLVDPLARRIPRLIIPRLIKIAGDAGSFRFAESKVQPLVSLFPNFSPEEAQALAQAAVENRQIWSATLCREEYLPELVRVQKENIADETLRALRYQIEFNEEFIERDGDENQPNF